MDYNCDEIWDWQGDDCGIEANMSEELSKCLLSGSNQNEDHLYCLFDDETTPVKACGDLAYHVNGTAAEVKGKEFNENGEHSFQVKRRRMLHFGDEVLDSPPSHDQILRCKEAPDSLDDAISDISEWVAGFAGPEESSSEYLDPSCEGWIADCFNDTEMHFTAEDIRVAAGPSDDQVENRELSSTTPEYDANAFEKPPVRSPRNIVFKGKKSYMRPPPKLASSVVYPFTFIKPCGVLGDVTLKDINKRIHTPPKPKQNEEDPSATQLTSAFSGKPVVGKTKIRTEGGEGSITILRTKG